MPTNFELAPPAKTVDGMLAVPIDIQSIRATVRLDGANQRATADATIEYIVGPTAGNPLFDLRQTIAEAWLDGAPFPIAQLAAHDVGGGPFGTMRIIASPQAAGSTHTLRLTYPLALPASQIAGAYLPVLAWSAGPRLRWSLGLSDLNAGRYLEAWLPANLIFDQYSISLDVALTGTAVPHAMISNGQVTATATNAWSIEFPARFTALSPLVELHACDTLVSQSDTVVLPVSGRRVTVDAYKPTAGIADLAAAVTQIKALLAANETDYGPYLHGDRFTAFFNINSNDPVGGMEYEGGTTTDEGSLLHETFHSWFARGVKPAAQADGWWDEAFTTYHEHGSTGIRPFDMSAPSVVLCSRDPWQRITPRNSYTDGERLFAGIAAIVGVDRLRTLMAELFQRYAGGTPVSTAMLEEHLVSRSGAPAVADAFHRFVYGLADPAPQPRRPRPRLRRHGGAPGGAPGGAIDHESGPAAAALWDSPDLWVRNTADDGETHQPPAPGQDNWFYARVHGDPEQPNPHVVVTFHSQWTAALHHEFPGDFLPSTTAAVVLDLAPGEIRVVKARWPAARVPPAGVHACVLASLLARAAHPRAGRHGAEQPGLAVKNRAVVAIAAGDFAIVPVVLNNPDPEPRSFELEVSREGSAACSVSLVSRSRELFEGRGGVVAFPDGSPSAPDAADDTRDCGSHRPHGHAPPPSGIISSRDPQAIAAAFPASWRASLDDPLHITLQPHDQRVVGLLVAIDRAASAGPSATIQLVERDPSSKRARGGLAVEIRVS